MQKLCQAFPVSTSSISLESHLQQIAMEGNFLTNMITTFRTALPAFVSKLRDVNMAFFNKTGQAKLVPLTLSSNDRNILDHMDMLDFLIFGDTYVMVPENFKGNLNAYAKELSRVAEAVFRMENKALQEYNMILSSFITNKDDKISIKDHTAFFTRVRNEREDLMGDLNKFFKNNNNKTRAPLRSVMQRFKDVEPFLEATTALTSTQNKASLDKIHNATNQCADLLDIIIKSMSEGKMDNISPEAANNIATGAYEIGKYVEFVSLVYFRISVLIAVGKSLLQDIADGVNNKPRSYRELEQESEQQE
jgi:hypothetical protein